MNLWTTLEPPDKLHHRIKARSATDGISLKTCLRQGVEARLGRKGEPARRRLPPVIAIPVAGKTLHITTEFQVDANVIPRA